MEKHIEQRMEKVHDALAKHWGSEFTLSVYASNGTEEEVQTSIDADIGTIYLCIGKDYVQLIHQQVYEMKWDLHFVNELNAFTSIAKYLLDDEGYITALHRVYTGEKLTEAVGRALVQNIEEYRSEISKLKTAYQNNIEKRDA